MAEPLVVRSADRDDLTADVAERLLGRLIELQATGRKVQLCLTGGGIAAAIYRVLGVNGARTPVDWTTIDLWWGDERFVPAGDSDRNDLEALKALAPLGFAPDRIHVMPASDGAVDLDAAAAAYADELADTTFDVCLLGVGPDGHVASLFPGHPSSTAAGRVIAVRNSPKPPPSRISLTLEVINASAEVWFCVSGAEKAEAVQRALAGADIPAAHAHGTRSTVWLVDGAAAGGLPA